MGREPRGGDPLHPERATTGDAEGDDVVMLRAVEIEMVVVVMLVVVVMVMMIGDDVIL